MAEDSRTSNSRRFRTAAWVAALVLVILTVLVARALWESREAIEQGRSLEATNPDEAIMGYRHAVEWYAPLNPYSRRAVQALLELGMREPRNGIERSRALDALESLRTGILVTRSFYTPYADVLSPVEARIARLRAEELADGDPDRLQAEQERLLALLVASRERAPDPFWATVTALAFVVWIGTTVQAIRKTWDGEGKRQVRRALPWAAAALLCLALWIAGLTLV